MRLIPHQVHGVQQVLFRSSSSILSRNLSLPGQLRHISLGRCHLDMLNPLPSETEIELTLSLWDRQIQARGKVRASRQGFGMGVAFTEVVGADLARLAGLGKNPWGSPPSALDCPPGLVRINLCANFHHISNLRLFDIEHLVLSSTRDSYDMQ